MSKNERWNSSGSIQVFDAQPGVLYSLEAAAHLTGVSRRSILIYCKSGLVRPILEEEYGAMSFNEDAIYAIRKIEYLRSSFGVNLSGIKLIFELTDEVQRLKEEIRFLRSV